MLMGWPLKREPRLTETLAAIRAYLDTLKGLLSGVAPGQPAFCCDCGWKLAEPGHEPFHSGWITYRRNLGRGWKDIPQTHETHGD